MDVAVAVIIFELFLVLLILSVIVKNHGNGGDE